MNEMKLKLKPWISLGVIKSTKIKKKCAGNLLKPKKFWYDRL